MAARLSTHDIAHMQDIFAGYGDWFSADLMRLIAKADFENRARLRLAFPDHVRAYDAYVAGGDEWDRLVATVSA